MKATLILNDDATPKFCKPRKLPLALKPVVGDELDHLEKQGVIKKKIPHSDWATPIVVARKIGGKVRICRFQNHNQSSSKDRHIPTTTS